MSAPYILPDAPATAVTGSTLTQYRRRLADELGMLAILTVSSTPSTGTTPDADRQVLAVGLQADGRPEDDLDGRWLYVVDGVQAGEVRQVLSGTYDGPFGSFLVDRPFSSPLASGTEIEITDTLPAARYGMVTGMLEVLNVALEELPVRDRVSLSAVTDQLRYTVTGLPFAVRKITNVYEPRLDADDPLVPLPAGWAYEQDASTPQLVLETAYATGKTLTLEIERPASTWISVAGTWASSSVGLANESDQALYDVITVVQQALPIAKRRMASLYPRGSKEREALRDEAQQDAWARTLSRFYGGFRQGSGAVTVGARGGGGTRPR